MDRDEAYRILNSVPDRFVPPNAREEAIRVLSDAPDRTLGEILVLMLARRGSATKQS